MKYLEPEIGQHRRAPGSSLRFASPASILTRLSAAALLLAGSAEAHVPAAATQPPRLAAAFTLEPWLVAPLALALGVYAVGLARFWRRAGVGRGIAVWEAAAHGSGLLALSFALIWPLDAYGEWSLAAHMGQHMLLIAVAAPLLLLGRPGVAWLAAAPKGGAAYLTRPIRTPLATRTMAVLSAPGVAALLQAAVMWGWHVPAAMELALASDPVHYVMHASFLGAGLLFWWSLLRSLREPRAGFGAGAVALVGTMMQMGLLSALLTFAPTPRFAFYAGRSEALGLTPLEDQQLAGLIMWVPSALPYLLGVLVLMAVWLRRLERDDTRRERRASAPR